MFHFFQIGKIPKFIWNHKHTRITDKKHVKMKISKECLVLPDIKPVKKLE